MHCIILLYIVVHCIISLYIVEFWLLPSQLWFYCCLNGKFQLLQWALNYLHPYVNSISTIARSIIGNSGQIEAIGIYRSNNSKTTAVKVIVKTPQCTKIWYNVLQYTVGWYNAHNSHSELECTTTHIVHYNVLQRTIMLKRAAMHCMRCNALECMWLFLMLLIVDCIHSHTYKIKQKQ
jgi:hypothetical protein